MPWHLVGDHDADGLLQECFPPQTCPLNLALEASGGRKMDTLLFCVGLSVDTAASEPDYHYDIERKVSKACFLAHCKVLISSLGCIDGGGVFHARRGQSADDQTYRSLFYHSHVYNIDRLEISTLAILPLSLSPDILTLP